MMFRFENSWLREPNCADIVEKSWFMADGLPILSKLSACSSDLVRWGYHRVRDFKAQIKECKDKMHQLRAKRNEASLTDFIEARDRYNELLHSHEVY